MFTLLTLLVVVTLSLLVTRIATIALVHTGLSRESARFQARSAFTGVGFTTTEAERVVGHPVRRRIVMALMLVGNAGLVTVMSTLILTFVEPDLPEARLGKIVVLFAGLLVLWRIATSPWVDRKLGALIDTALERYTDLEIRDYASLLQLVGGYRIVELQVDDSDWLAGRTLSELRLRDEGIVVLGVERSDGSYLGTPKGDVRLRAGETLILYGRAPALAALDQRRGGRGGDAAHREAVDEQAAIARHEHTADDA